MARAVSPITQPGHRKGVPNRYKGATFDVERLTREEIEAMKEQCNCGIMGLRNRAILDFLYGTGARCGEMCGQCVADINRETGVVLIRGTKTKNAVRPVGCNPAARPAVRDWLDTAEAEGVPGPYAFPCLSKWERGNRIKGPQVRQMFKHLAKKAGIEGKRVHPHACRHNFACELRAEGKSLEVIMAALGHANMATTFIYLNHIDRSEVVSETLNRKSPATMPIVPPGLTPDVVELMREFLVELEVRSP